MTNRPRYPFTAIVGQERMKLALVLNAVHPSLGGVLVRGEKGTAKSTAVRALASLLPEIEVVRGCGFGCDPADAEPCDGCATRRAAGEAPETFRQHIPMVELPVGATEDRVLGSLDLEHAISAGARRFEPGLLAQANRGILYVDEVNLLNDHLVDILLDAAAMGRNYVEREGISVSHPARFMLVGTMNPEEGELRPQLLDRFALTVQVESMRDPTLRAEVVRRRMAFESDPGGFVAEWTDAERAERERLARARALLPSVTVPEAMLRLIVHVCAAFEVDGLRADLAMYRAAAARAAYEGRREVTADDVRAAAELALPHRRRRQPFEQPGLDQQRLEEVIEGVGDEGGSDEDSDDPSRDGSETPPSGDQAPARTAGPSQGTRAAGQARTPQSSQRPSPSEGRREEVVHAPTDAFPVIPLTPSRRRAGSARAAGRSDRSGNPTPTGPAVRTAIPSGSAGELALAATVRAAAPHQPERRRARADAAHPGDSPLLIVRPEDVRERVRHGRSRSLILLTVDASGSMGARDRMAATKGAVLSLLLDAYRRRDRVGLIAFRGTGAELILPPTNSVDLAERRLRSLPTGGRTPIAAGLDLCSETIVRIQRSLDATPLVVLVSDIRPNTAPAGADPWRAALDAAGRIRAAGWDAILIDTESARNALGLGRSLAGAMGARYLKLEQLRAGQLEQTIRARLVD